MTVKVLPQLKKLLLEFPLHLGLPVAVVSSLVMLAVLGLLEKSTSVSRQVILNAYTNSVKLSEGVDSTHVSGKVLYLI